MAHYLCPKTKRYFIQFQLLNKTWKRRLPVTMSEDEMDRFEERWRDSIINDTPLPVLEKRHHRSQHHSGRMPGFVYVFEMAGFYKIGRSFNALSRLSALRTASPFPVELILSIPSNRPGNLEKEIHAKFQSKHERGEWYRLTDEDVAELRTMVP
jgi:hypothetical protein